MSRWYRAYAGTVTDDKLAEAALVAGCSRSVVIATWHAILESCATTQGKGEFQTTARRVAAILAEPLEMMERIFSLLNDIGLISGNVVCAWAEKHAPPIQRPFAGTTKWKSLRVFVFRRDGYRCLYCGDQAGPFDCDHIIPFSRGGSNDPDNLATACRPCNRSKRAKTPAEWLQ